MSSVSDFLKELLKEHPELHSFYDSEQYKLSEQIIEHMVNNCMTDEQMADFLGLDLNYYIRLESGDNSIDVNEYKKVLNKLQEKI